MPGSAGRILSSRLNASSRTSHSDGVVSGFSRPDPDRLFDRRNDNFSVADPTGLGGATDRIDCFFNHLVAKHNFNLHFWQKIDNVLGAPIKLGVPLLASKALGFR